MRQLKSFHYWCHVTILRLIKLFARPIDKIRIQINILHHGVFLNRVHAIWIYWLNQIWTYHSCDSRSFMNLCKLDFHLLKFLSHFKGHLDVILLTIFLHDFHFFSQSLHKIFEYFLNYVVVYSWLNNREFLQVIEDKLLISQGILDRVLSHLCLGIFMKVLPLIK